MELAIKDLLATESEKTIWITYLDDFSIHIRYLPRRELVKISESSTERTWDRKSHDQLTKVNTDRFYSKFVEKAVIGWRGLTLKTLSNIIDIKLDGRDPNTEVPFTKENAIEILRSAYDLDSFLQSAILDIQQFDVEEADILKKI